MTARDRAPLLAALDVTGFRSLRRVEVAPLHLCALVGGARAGKSNLLAAIRAVLDPATDADPSDVPRDADGELRVTATLANGATAELVGAEPSTKLVAGELPPVLFLPAEARAHDVIAMPPEPPEAARRFQAALAEPSTDDSAAASALSMLAAVERCCALGIRGALLLIEEPELYLRPQAQRYLYRLLRQFAEGGNQVIYSTHSPAFLNVAHLDELVFVERRAGGSTRALQPEPVSPDEDFRVLSEFDAERAELFLARAVVLVEGQTEKLALPFVFDALGHDVDRAGISIIECGGKWNIPLFARVCRAAGVPFVAVYDSDARPGHKPSAANRAIAAKIRALAGPAHTVELSPDLEAVAGIHGGGHGKPERAWRRFAKLTPEQLPAPLVRTAELAIELASSPHAGRPPTGSAD